MPCRRSGRFRLLHSLKFFRNSIATRRNGRILSYDRIHGGSKLIGLLGHPIAHSLSPLLHNTSCETLSLDCVYLPLDIVFPSRQTLESFLGHLENSNFIGFNVTLPYKKWVAESLGSELVSVNTVYRDQGGAWQATSTDGQGFIAALEKMAPLSSFQRIVCIGNGGAALAVTASLLAANASVELSVLRRSKRDELWRQSLRRDAIDFLPLSAEALASALQAPERTLLLQASSAPVHGDPLAELAENLPRFNGVLIDMVYGYQSAILEAVKAFGLPCQDGVPMLIEQARASQRLWFGECLSYDQLLAIMQKHSRAQKRHDSDRRQGS